MGRRRERRRWEDQAEAKLAMALARHGGLPRTQRPGPQQRTGQSTSAPGRTAGTAAAVYCRTAGRARVMGGKSPQRRHGKHVASWVEPKIMPVVTVRVNSERTYRNKHLRNSEDKLVVTGEIPSDRCAKW